MNENAKKWVEALRSGKYEQQTESALQTDNGYCCLGVACVIYQEEKGNLSIGKAQTASSVLYTFDGESAYLPKKVQKWLGLYNAHGGLFLGMNSGTSLPALNDRGTSFKEIADIIEREPEGLFV